MRPIRQEDNSQVEELIIKVMTEYQCIGDKYSSSDPEVKAMFEAYNNDKSAFFVIEYHTCPK